jgi:hypothetical protein
MCLTTAKQGHLQTSTRTTAQDKIIQSVHMKSPPLTNQSK